MNSKFFFLGRFHGSPPIKYFDNPEKPSAGRFSKIRSLEGILFFLFFFVKEIFGFADFEKRTPTPLKKGGIESEYSATLGNVSLVSYLAMREQLGGFQLEITKKK